MYIRGQSRYFTILIGGNHMSSFESFGLGHCYATKSTKISDVHFQNTPPPEVHLSHFKLCSRAGLDWAHLREMHFIRGYLESAVTEQNKVHGPECSAKELHPFSCSVSARLACKLSAFTGPEPPKVYGTARMPSYHGAGSSEGGVCKKPGCGTNLTKAQPHRGDHYFSCYEFNRMHQDDLIWINNA